MSDNTSPRAPGRPSKLTPECVGRLTEALRAGHTRGTAAELAGVGESTLYSWLAAAAQPGALPEFLEFRDAIRAAEFQGEDILLGHIRSAAPKSWQAAAWILGHRHPDRWGTKVKSEVVVQTPMPSGSSAADALREAEHHADQMRRVMDLCRAQTPFEEWSEELQAASGFRI
jgi:hypothetical protein